MKNSEDYGDYKYEEMKQEQVDRADERTKKCKHCLGFTTTDRKHFAEKGHATQHQYDLERGSDRKASDETRCCVGHEFENWWYNEGSAPPKARKGKATFPYREDDWETHCKKMCFIAWKNGAYIASRE